MPIAVADEKLTVISRENYHAKLIIDAFELVDPSLQAALSVRLEDLGIAGVAVGNYRLVSNAPLRNLEIALELMQSTEDIADLGATGAYTPASPGNWVGAPPATTKAAIDRLAARMAGLFGPIP